jgi:hypothetical protein
MSFSDEFLNKWEHIINGVDVTEVPLECIKKIVIGLQGGRRRTVNLQRLRARGLDYDAIETVLERTLSELGEDVRGTEFIVDVEAVATIVQIETDKILNGL